MRVLLSVPLHFVLYILLLCPTGFFRLPFITFLSLQSRSLSSLADICLRPVFQTTTLSLERRLITIILI